MASQEDSSVLSRGLSRRDLLKKGVPKSLFALSVLTSGVGTATLHDTQIHQENLKAKAVQVFPSRSINDPTGDGIISDNRNAFIKRETNKNRIKDFCSRLAIGSGLVVGLISAEMRRSNQEVEDNSKPPLSEYTVIPEI